MRKDKIIKLNYNIIMKELFLFWHTVAIVFFIIEIINIIVIFSTVGTLTLSQFMFFIACDLVVEFTKDIYKHVKEQEDVKRD